MANLFYNTFSKGKIKENSLKIVLTTSVSNINLKKWV